MFGRCAFCHSRRGRTWEAHTPGDPIGQWGRLAILDEGLYEADGTQLDEVYKVGSFLQSRMYAAGVRCSDCHDPHTGKPRAEGNAPGFWQQLRREPVRVVSALVVIAALVALCALPYFLLRD